MEQTEINEPYIAMANGAPAFQAVSNSARPGAGPSEKIGMARAAPSPAKAPASARMAASRRTSAAKRRNASWASASGSSNAMRPLLGA